MKQYQGLSEKEVAASREAYGTNLLVGKKRQPFFKKLLKNFKDPIIRVLLIALGLNLLFTIGHINYFECIGILLAIILSTLVSTLSEMGSESAFEKLTKESAGTFCHVFRGGMLEKIPIEKLVVGDIVALGMGDVIPADGILLEGSVLVNQAALNGESKEAKKQASKEATKRALDAKNRLFRASLVTRGSAVMQVTEVGESTFLGAVAKDLLEDARESPLKLRLSKLADTISKIGYLLAAAVALSYLFSVIFLNTDFDKAAIVSLIKDYRTLFLHLVRALTLAVTVVVVAVPEGLPMMICVVLSSNMKRMLKDKILVKKMVGIETAGSLNILFSDKTGTFTTGMQDVKGFLLADGRLLEDMHLLKREAVYTHLLNNARYNTECEWVRGEVAGSNASDRAIVRYFVKESKPIGMVYGGIPFDSRYKYSAARTPDGKVLIKGAPELLLSHIQKSFDGKTLDHKVLIEAYERYTGEASRLILIALADSLPTAIAFPELYFVAFAVIQDPLRESTVDAVKAMQGAGIQVVMVTGDSPDTATAIAAKSGLLEEKDRLVLTGEELSRLTDEALCECLPRLSVVARALPQDKTRLVRVAQSKDWVVGMTGDGVNDAPALKLADVGFAMGSGTDVAKEAGDIVILDNDMAAMVKAVLYGRTIFKSIRKFIIFQLTMNFCAVGVTLLGPLFGVPSPITVIQMLWVNMIMDTLGGLAFAGEAPEKHTLTEKPKTRREPLLSRGAFGKVVFNGITALTLCTLFMALDFFKNAFSFDSQPLVYYSAFFSLFIFMGVVTFYIARSDRLNFLSGLLQNTSFLLITLLVTAVQLLMVYFGGAVFGTTPLSARILFGVAILSTVILPLDLIRRAIVQKRE